MSTLKVNYIQANTTSEIDINSPLGTIPSLDVSGSTTIGGNLNITGVSTFTGNSYVAGNLGIGTASPGAKLHLIGNQYLQGGNYFTDTTSGYFWAGNGSYAGGIYGSNSGNVTTIISPQTINLVTSSTQRLSIDSSGRITTPSQPVFKAYRSASTSGAGVIVFNTEIYDVGNNYNNSNGLFTAPVAGYYIFFFLSIGSGVSNTFRDVWGSVNGATTPSSFGARPTNQTTDYSSSGAATNIVYLNANDTFGLYASGTLYSDSNIWLQFGGYLLG